MALLVVRHGIAVDRSDWRGPDELRPLTRAGRRQARDLARWLAGWARHHRLGPLLSSPAERCVATLQPFAALAHLAVDERDDLLRGRADDAARLASTLAGAAGGVLCTHGEVIRPLLRSLAAVPRGGDPGNDPSLVDSEKGSLWVVDAEGDGLAAAHVPPAVIEQCPR